MAFSGGGGMGGGGCEPEHARLGGVGGGNAGGCVFPLERCCKPQGDFFSEGIVEEEEDFSSSSFKMREDILTEAD